MESLLERVNSPADLKSLSQPELGKLAAELRDLLVGTVSLNGGHLAANLGVVELTIALHRVFDSPTDRIVWDVGHQSYVHKLLTGRRDRFSTLRCCDGLSGFTAREESPHDPFGAGHAGTSISAALGMAVARDLLGLQHQVVAVIGDGAIASGMAFEAVNHAGHLGKKLIVVLNDNGMSISPSVGALSRLLNLIRVDRRYEFAKREAKKALTRLPLGNLAWDASQELKARLQKALLPSAFWGELGFVYLGPIDGHNIAEIEAMLERARDYETGPTVVHVVTRKGMGYAPAEKDATKFHGVPRQVATGGTDGPSYSKVFGQALHRLMEQDERVVAITAAMLDGTGVEEVASDFPARVFDVGICEQHAVTLAAGLATQGFVPVIAVYSTFLQRAYDQIIHDVCIQNLPVVFAVDRAGIVGDDGRTHQGAFDISYLRSIPNMIVAAPRDAEELQHLLITAVNCGMPAAIRYPRGRIGRPLEECSLGELPIGRGELLREGKDVTLVCVGPASYAALEAAAQLWERDIDCSVVNARFIKPLDHELILHWASRTKRLVAVEENAVIGGFGEAVVQLVHQSGLDDVKVRCVGLPDRFIEHGPQSLIRSRLGLDAQGIARTAAALVQEEMGVSAWSGQRTAG
ncbi:MAG: 1-deoxy-D-xylulose-5-phosphate synthase [Chloroflexota bacterium]